MKFSTINKSPVSSITELFATTFSDSDGPAEGKVIGNLVDELLRRTPENDLYGFVAVDDSKNRAEGDNRDNGEEDSGDNGEPAGCILFTRLRFDDSGTVAFLLSPVAIATRHQRKGIGQQLINFGIDTLKANGVELLVTYGDPAYYSKVGFITISESVLRAPFTLSQPHGWLGQSLVSDRVEPITGNSHCVAAFSKPELW